MKRWTILDLLRGIAIFLMFITHFYRLQLPLDPVSSSLENIFLFFMKIEPFTAALFLYIAGLSINLSFSNCHNKKQWNSIVNKKLIILLFISILLGGLESFFSIKRMFLSSSILFVILISILIQKEILLKYKHKQNFLNSFFFIAIIVTTIILDYFKINILGISSGSGALFPVIGFSFLGSLGYSFIEDQKNKKILSFLIIISISILSMRIQPFVNVLENTDFSLLRNEMLPFSSWNYTTSGLFLNSLILLSITIIIKKVKKYNIKYPKFLIMMGKNSLFLYVYHLAIVNLFVYTDTILDHPLNTMVLLFVSIIILPMLYDFKKQIKKLFFRL